MTTWIFLANLRVKHHMKKKRYPRSSVESLETRRLLAVPAAASNVLANAAAAPSTTQINVKWTDNSNNETGFRIERNSDPFEAAGSWALDGTVGANVTSYTSGGLVSGVSYSYRV